MTNSPGDPKTLVAAIMLCVAGVALFSIMDVAMKGLAIAIGAYSAVFWRNILGTFISGCGMLAMRNPWPEKKVLRLHIVRAALIGPMAVLFFWALTRMPLAEAIFLSCIAPVIAHYLSAILLEVHISRYCVLAAILGLAGVVVIVSHRLSGQYDSGALWGVVAVLVSAVMFAANLVVQRQQAQVASAIEIAFFQNMLVLMVLLPFAPWLLKWWSIDMLPFVVMSAVLAVCSQMILAKAYARAPASRLIPIEYSAFAWAALFGWLVFDEHVTWAVIAGVVLIIAACFVAAREKPRLAAHIEAETA